MSRAGEYADSVARLLSQQGQIRGQAIANKGQILGSTIATIGDVAGQALTGYFGKKEADKKEQAWRDLFKRSQDAWDIQQQQPPDGSVGPELSQARPPRQSPFPTPTEILGTFGPHEGIPVINGIAALHKLDPQAPAPMKLEQLQTIYKMLETVPEGLRAEKWPEVVGLLKQVGYLPKDLPDVPFTQTMFEGIGNTLRQAAEGKLERVETVNPEGVAGTQFVEPTAGAFYQKPPEAPKVPTPDKPPNVGSFEDFVLRSYGPNPTPAQVVKARKDYGQADDRTITISPTMQAEQSNAKETALGIKDGTISPEVLLSTRATAQGMALNAELHKMGVDTNKMTREWSATKRAIGSLNSTQQVRLSQAINKASASLDKLEELNTAWSQNAARWGLKALNHAELKAAQNGAFGPEAASVAQRLDAQIADVVGELGQTIMGGNSPTDHSMELAAKNLSTDWTQKVLADSIKQVRYNLGLAQSARNEMLEKMGVGSTQFQTPPPANTTTPPPAPRQNPFRR